ncbi:MAG: hypothetical protein QM498_09440 [Desulfobacterium sp.]
MTQLYKYCAATIEEATRLIRNSLGADAMIISTDRLRGRDGKEFFEICAVPGDCPQEKPDSRAFGDIKNELVSIKEMMRLMSTSPMAIPLSHLVKNPMLMQLYARMMDQGIEEVWIKEILTQAGVFDNMKPLSAENVKKQVVTALMQTLDVKDPFATQKHPQIIAAFVGTTGVGKTTTIAKIAANLMVQQRKKVGLISIDTYRIGAMEQLKNYADILGVPCFQAFTRSDLLLALGRMRAMDVVLIDTAGRSQYDMPRLEGLKKMIGDHASIDTHLLLSVGMSASEMKTTARSFSGLNFKTYIFTKLDEARMMGNIVNQMATYKIPISYVTAGQNVPEDIERADRKKLVTLLLGKNKTG